MKTITHTRGSLETADVVADSIGALDNALRENDLVARLEIPVSTVHGTVTTIEVILGKRQTVSTEPSHVQVSDGRRPDPYEFDWL
jgi:hypothetical protein